MRNKLIPYNPKLKLLARQLRKQGILSEVLLWKQIQKNATGAEFHRQVPLLEYIVDFYCHELMLAIEIDGITHDSEEAVVKDEHRQKQLEAYGVSFLRFADADVKANLEGVVQTIINKVEEIRKSA